MNKRTSLFLLIPLVLFASQLKAYKQSTHALMVEHAVELTKSNVPENKVLSSLGLGSNFNDANFRLPGTQRSGTPKELMSQGVVDEDEGHNALNHFFDPQQGGKGLDLPFLEDYPSPVWMLAAPGQIASQQYSYEDAKRYFYDGLTKSASKYERDRNLGMMFESLGHVVHHLEDMSQPQHVRNDKHCDIPLCEAAGGPVYRPSSYEVYVQGLNSALPFDDTYPVPTHVNFPTPRSFWENAGLGIAEFTSNNFISIRTNFMLDSSTSPPRILSDNTYATNLSLRSNHPNPSGAEATLVNRSINDPELLGPITGGLPIAGNVSFVRTPIRDFQAGIFGSNSKASTLSIWYDSLDIIETTGEVVATPSRGFTVNSFTYQAAAELLVPRATAYTTGMIDYFFRGRIDISLSDDGIYSIADQSTGAGFTKVKVKLKNVPRSGGAPQNMSGGRLMLIAKYTKNTCYESDLSGELEGNGQTPPSGCSTYLNVEEKISKSQELSGISLPPNVEVPFTFEFGNEPIPFAARDLRLQVVYRGALGSEDDGMAFGSVNISAPTYFLILNNSDYFNLNGAFYTPEEIRSNPALHSQVNGVRSIDPAPLKIKSFKVIGKESVAGPVTVPVRGYVRFALLLPDSGTTDFRMTSSYEEQGNTEEDVYSYDYPGVLPLLIRIANSWLPELKVLQTTGRFRGVRGNTFLVVVKSHPPGVPPTDAALQSLRQKSYTDPGPTMIPMHFQ